MSTTCDIRFINNPIVYYGGQLLEGTASLTTRKLKTIRAIHIEITGRAKVKWTERKSRRGADGKTHYYNETYYGHEHYLSSRTYVLGNDRGDSTDFPAGLYTYNFQLHLPQQLPSSFSGAYGDVHYEVKLTIDRPWRFDNEFSKPFTVISQLDLNYNPSYKTPVEQSDIKEFWCGCCNVQPLKMKVLIPFNGFAPGQKIPFYIYADNESNIDVDGIKIKLERTVQFTATSPHTKSRWDTTKIAEKLLPSVLRLSRKEFRDFLEIPSVPPSSLQTCSIIHITYNIVATARISGCHRNMDITIPITIGTVPLLESATNPQSTITVQPTAPQIENSDAPPAYVTPTVPPTYEQAISLGGDVFVDDDENNVHKKVEPFVPKYPMYYNFAAPSAPVPDLASNNLPNSSTNGISIPSTSFIPNEANNEQVKASTTTPYGWNA